MARYRISFRKGIYGTKSRWQSDIEASSFSEAYKTLEAERDRLGLRGQCHMRVEPLKCTQDRTLEAHCAKAGR